MSIWLARNFTTIHLTGAKFQNNSYKFSFHPKVYVRWQFITLWRHKPVARCSTFSETFFLQVCWVGNYSAYNTKYADSFEFILLIWILKNFWFVSNNKHPSSLAYSLWGWKLWDCHIATIEKHGFKVIICLHFLHKAPTCVLHYFELESIWMSMQGVCFIKTREQFHLSESNSNIES